MLTQHEKLSWNKKFSHLSKALQHFFNEKNVVSLQWDFMWWLFPIEKRQGNRFPASAMLYSFAVLLSSKSFALYLFCSGLNAQWQRDLCKSVDKCCNTICPAENWYFSLKFSWGFHCFAALGPNLEDLKQRLDVADGKMNTLKIDLVTAQNNLNGINRGLLLSHHFWPAPFICYYKNLHVHFCVFQVTLTTSSPVQGTWQKMPTLSPTVCWMIWPQLKKKWKELRVTMEAHRVPASIKHWWKQTIQVLQVLCGICQITVGWTRPVLHSKVRHAS